MLTAVKGLVTCVFDCGRVSCLRHGSDEGTGWQRGVATAALDPWLAKDPVVTPDPDRRGEAEMSHVCLSTELFRVRTTTGKQPTFASGSS